MPEIRTLKPLVKIRMPSARKSGYRPSQVKVVQRLRRDFPPPTPQPTPCVIWQGAQGRDGYGWRKVEGKPMSMHRWVMAGISGTQIAANGGGAARL